MKALLDADTMAYRSAAACKDESVRTMTLTLDGIVTDALLSCDTDDRFYDKWQLYLTGSDNFRKQISAEYKANRTSPKPEHLPAARQHLIEQWGAVVAEGQEADDAIAIEATKLNDNFVIVSIDKDLNMIRGHHYNFVKEEKYFITEEEAIRNFYLQILTGDKVDNIIGLDGIGPVKSKKLLKDCNTELEMYEAVLKAYDGDEARVLENARLLWILREEKQVWHPPVK